MTIAGRLGRSMVIIYPAITLEIWIVTVMEKYTKEKKQGEIYAQ